MSLAATLMSRLALLVGGRVILLLLTLLTTAILTRTLGPAGFGHYRTAVAYLGLVVILADLGLASIFVREISRKGADQPRLIANALALRLTIAVTAMIVALGLAYVLPLAPADRLGIVGGALGFVAYSVHLLLFGLFQQKLRQHGVVLAEVSGGLVLVMAILALNQLGAEPVWFVVSLGASYLVTLAVSLVAAQRLVRCGLRLEPAVWSRLTRAALPLAAASTVMILYFRMDTVFLAMLQPSEVVGLYGVPVKVMDACMGISILFVGLFAPFLARTAHVDRTGFAQHLERGLMTLCLATVGIAIGMIALAREIVVLLAGGAFVEAALILQILAGVLVLHGATILMREAATALAIQRRLLPGYLVGLAVAFSGYAILIPRFGGAGAAAALLLAEIVVVCTALWVVLREVGTVGVLRIPLLALGCGLAAAAVLLIVDQAGWGWFARLATGGLVYLGLLLLTRAVSLPAMLALARELISGKVSSDHRTGVEVPTQGRAAVAGGISENRAG